VKSQCFPFSQIPHTTKLFADFLSYSPTVQQFFPHSPRFGDWFRDESTFPSYDDARRERVCAVLQRQNTSWNASAKTIDNIARMRGGAAAVVTGQQVGLVGGPLFSLFKALTAIKLAEQASAAGVDCVPVFWLASSDHDLEEVNHVFVPGPDGSLHNIIAPSKGTLHAPVGTIKFGAEIEDVTKAAADVLGESEITGILREAYRTGETFLTSFARLFSRLFSEWGVILLDASDPELHRIAEPVYRRAIERAAELDHALQAQGKALEEVGYDQQVKVTPSSTLLFTLSAGARVPIHRRTPGASDVTEFTFGDERLSQHELLDRIATTPENFSPNVLLRPVVQDYLLPTLAYAGGAAEIAYFAQTGVVYKALSGTITPIVPRFSATIVTPKLQALLERYNLRLPDVFRAPDSLRETLAMRAMPQTLQTHFDNAEAALEGSMSPIREALASLDKTLVESATTAESKMLYQLRGLRSRAARAELRHSEVLERHAELLSNTLYPNKTLQEREIGGVYFLARHGTEFLRGLYGAIQTDCLDHQIITL
jgi:bacillithiol biosynthesis cysteine-adding enzyme BshC